MSTIVTIGEILWDVFPDSEKLGGAPFNFSVNASRLGHDVHFISAVGADDRGEAALAQASALGLSTDFIQRVPHAPTGAVSVRIDPAGVPDFTIHRPAAYDEFTLDPTSLAGIEPDWVYFGTLYPFHPNGLTQLKRLLEACPRARRFYDVNLRRNAHSPELVAELLSLANVLKLNEDEAALVDTSAWKGNALAITRGANGCLVRVGDDSAEVPGIPVKVADTVGAGDAFAAVFLHGLTQHWPAKKIGDFANRLGALIASRAGGVPGWSIEELEHQP